VARFSDLKRRALNRAVWHRVRIGQDDGDNEGNPKGFAVDIVRWPQNAEKAAQATAGVAVAAGDLKTPVFAGQDSALVQPGPLHRPPPREGRRFVPLGIARSLRLRVSTPDR
jgi:hypothetical protein